MTRAELVELLMVERHLPLPPMPPEPEPVFEPDTPANRLKRRAELNRALHVPKKRKPIPPVRAVKSDPSVHLVKKGLIYVADRSAA